MLYINQQRHPAPAQPIPGLTYEQEPSPIDTSAQGLALIVTSVQNGGAADHAGISVGDMIDQINGQPVRSHSDVVRSVASGKRPTLSLRMKHGGDWVTRDLPAPHRSSTL